MRARRACPGGAIGAEQSGARCSRITAASRCTASMRTRCSTAGRAASHDAERRRSRFAAVHRASVRHAARTLSAPAPFALQAAAGARACRSSSSSGRSSRSGSMRSSRHGVEAGALRRQQRLHRAGPTAGADAISRSCAKRHRGCSTARRSIGFLKVDRDLGDRITANPTSATRSISSCRSVRARASTRPAVRRSSKVAGGAGSKVRHGLPASSTTLNVAEIRHRIARAISGCRRDRRESTSSSSATTR